MFTFHFSLPSKVIGAEGNDSPSITRGEIYIETDHGYFPCMGWSDRLLSVISQWMGNSIMRDLADEEQPVAYYFMNGPYFFTLQETGGDRLTIRFIRHIGESEEVEEIPSLTIAGADYRNALLQLTESLLRDPGFQWLENEHRRILFEQSVARFKAT